MASDGHQGNCWTFHVYSLWRSLLTTAVAVRERCILCSVFFPGVYSVGYRSDFRTPGRHDFIVDWLLGGNVTIGIGQYIHNTLRSTHEAHPEILALVCRYKGST